MLAGEKLFEHGADIGHVHGGDLPDDLQIHVGVVMSHDVPHAAHFSQGEFGYGLPGRRGQMRRGLADDFDASDNGILFLLVSAEIGLGRVADVRADQPRGFQDVAQSAELSVSIQAHGTGQDVLTGIVVR